MKSWTYYEQPTIGLSLYRVILSFLVLKNAIFYLPMAEELFGANGIVPFNDYITLMGYFKINFLIYPFNVQFASQIFLVIIIILACCFMFAIGNKLVGILFLICVFSLNQRNGFILDGSDNVISTTLPFLIFSDSYKYFRYDEKSIVTRHLSLKNKSIIQLSVFFSFMCLIALKIQICYVYFFTALHKLQGDMWLNGTAIYYTMRVQEFMATKWNIPLTQNHYFVVMSTYFTIFWELSFCYLVWFRSTRLFILFFGTILHIGIWIFMRIDNFSWIMIASYLFFIPDKEYMNFTYQLNMTYNRLIAHQSVWAAYFAKLHMFLNKNHKQSDHH